MLLHRNVKFVSLVSLVWLSYLPQLWSREPPGTCQRLEGLCSPPLHPPQKKERRLTQEFNLFASGDSLFFHFRKMWVQWEMPITM